MSRERVAKTFDRWAEEGHAEGMEKGHGDVVEQVIDAMGLAPGEKVLDLGCGNGWATRKLAQANAGVQAIGVDCSPQMIARADELHSFTIRARYDFGFFEELEFKDGEFDRIFSMEAIYYATDLARSLREALRVLKPGGRADIVVDYYKEAPGTDVWPKQIGLDMASFSEAEWQANFEQAGFVNVTTRRVIDRRGPGDESEHEAEAWLRRVANHEAGSLWIQAEKPA